MPPSLQKRNKEKLRQERQRDKELKRQQRKAARETRLDATPGFDPDIEGIVPGPQPVTEEP